MRHFISDRMRWQRQGNGLGNGQNISMHGRGGVSVNTNLSKRFLQNLKKKKKKSFFNIYLVVFFRIIT